MLLIWIAIFIFSLVILVKGADWLLVSAEKIGLAAGLSSFVIGVTIVGLGTSFPELISALIAVARNVTEIVPANAIGSNIANILLVVGLSSIVGRRLVVSKSLINIDLPLLSITTVLLLGVAWDRQITLLESILLIITYIIYFSYTIFYREDAEEVDEALEMIPSRADRRKHITIAKNKKTKRPKLVRRDFLLLGIGIFALIIGAKYLIDSVIALSAILGIGAGAISLAAVALGTSLPELLVSIKAAWNKKSEIALGNIFGSNVFNLMIVIGIPGLFKTLVVDEKTFSLGLPVLAAATLLFVISGISRKIYMWEGAMYVILYIFFIGKLFDLL